MKCIRQIFTFVFALIYITSCQQTKPPDLTISKEEMLKIVKSNDDKFSIGVKTKDAAMLAEIYSDSAQYVQPGRSIIDGKDSIRKDWQGFIDLKEKPVDLILLILIVLCSY